VVAFRVSSTNALFDASSNRPHAVLLCAIRREAAMELNEFRELALRFRALAEHGTEGELRAELKRLSAELAGWIVSREIQAMVGKDTPT
jgi:hypothetical protein